IQGNSQEVGYVAVTLCYSMTYGGLSAVVDDFFVQPAFRGAGLGKAALAQVRNFCTSNGIRAIRVETGHENAAALAVYRRVGFVGGNPAPPFRPLSVTHPPPPPPPPRNKTPR